MVTKRPRLSLIAAFTANSRNVTDDWPHSQLGVGKALGLGRRREREVAAEAWIQQKPSGKLVSPCRRSRKSYSADTHLLNTFHFSAASCGHMHGPAGTGSQTGSEYVWLIICGNGLKEEADKDVLQGEVRTRHFQLKEQFYVVYKQCLTYLTPRTCLIWL